MASQKDVHVSQWMKEAKCTMQFLYQHFGDGALDCSEASDLSKSRIGFALHGPPMNAFDINSSPYMAYSVQQRSAIKYIFEAIKKVADVDNEEQVVKVSLLFVCCFTSNTPFIDPIFKVLKAKNRGEHSFIDSVGSHYPDWKSYITDNCLPECIYYSFENGNYLVNEQGTLNIKLRPSPKCFLNQIPTVWFQKTALRMFHTTDNPMEIDFNKFIADFMPEGSSGKHITADMRSGISGAICSLQNQQLTERSISPPAEEIVHLPNNTTLNKKFATGYELLIDSSFKSHTNNNNSCNRDTDLQTCRLIAQLLFLNCECLVDAQHNIITNNKQQKIHEKISNSAGAMRSFIRCNMIKTTEEAVNVNFLNSGQQLQQNDHDSECKVRLGMQIIFVNEDLLVHQDKYEALSINQEDIIIIENFTGEVKFLKDSKSGLLSKEDIEKIPNSLKFSKISKTEHIHFEHQRQIATKTIYGAFQKNSLDELEIAGRNIFAHSTAFEVVRLGELLSRYKNKNCDDQLLNLCMELAESQTCSSVEDFINMTEFVFHYIENTRMEVNGRYETAKAALKDTKEYKSLSKKAQIMQLKKYDEDYTDKDYEISAGILAPGVKRDVLFFRGAVNKVNKTIDVMKADYENFKNQVLKANTSNDGALIFSNDHAATYHCYKHKDGFEIGLSITKYFQLAREFFSNNLPTKKTLSQLGELTFFSYCFPSPERVILGTLISGNEICGSITNRGQFIITFFVQ